MTEQDNLETDLQELQLALPLEASMLATLEPMGRWARAVHSLMYEANPWMMLRLHEKGALVEYLQSQDETLADQARKLEAQFRKNNPLPQTATHLSRTAWHNQAKSFAAESLMNSVSEQIVSLRAEYRGTTIH